MQYCISVPSSDQLAAMECYLPTRFHEKEWDVKSSECSCDDKSSYVCRYSLVHPYLWWRRFRPSNRI